MLPFDRSLWRLAGRLEARLTCRDPQHVPQRLDQAGWLAARRLESRLEQIAGRHWAAAGDHLSWRFQHSLQLLQTSLGQLQQQLSSQGTYSGPPLQRQLYEELQATVDTFPDCTFDLRQQTLTVITEPITLEETYLGPFRIELDLKTLGGTATYRVIAENPNCSAASPDVAHPHVSCESLCEGDGSASLDCALRTGRFSDFFQIVIQTLQTYNAHSAYASLDEWEDCTACHACGDRVSERDCCYCDTCHDSTCENCSTSCPQCGDSACDVCIRHCEQCGESACTDCLEQTHRTCVAVVQTV